MEYLGYAAMILVGVSLGLIGGGGSILTVPILAYLFTLPAVDATAYSLFIVGVASLVGAYRYHQASLIDYRTGIIFALPSFVGVFVARRFVIPQLPDVIFASSWFVLGKDQLILGAFAVIMITAAYSMIRKSSPRVSENENPRTGSQPFALIGLEGFVVGAVTGFVGAGGGFIIIPALVLLAKLPMKMAIGTSLMVIASKSLVGFAGDLSAGLLVDWPFLARITLTAIGRPFCSSIKCH